MPCLVPLDALQMGRNALEHSWKQSRVLWTELLTCCFSIGKRMSPELWKDSCVDAVDTAGALNHEPLLICMGDDIILYQDVHLYGLDCLGALFAFLWSRVPGPPW